MKRTLKVRVGSVASALDRFEEVSNKAARGEKVPAEHVLTFVNLQLLLRTFTPAQPSVPGRRSGAASVSLRSRRPGNTSKPWRS